MNEPNVVSRVCLNGHPSRDGLAKFCISCGAPLHPVSGQPPVDAAPPANGEQNAPPRNVSNAPPLQPAQMPQNFNYPPPVNQYPPNYYPPPYPNYYPQQMPPNYYPPNQYPMPQYQQMPQCRTCGGDGRTLNRQTVICPECRWLRPLAPGYAIDAAAFQWAEDGRAMSTLRSIGTLTSMAQAISDKVGRRWIETAFNGILLSEKQLPEIYAQAVRAARILGMSHMPDVYVSGDVMWDCRTYGSDKNAFVVMGTALATNFSGADLLFLLAREMGHCRAGHALWKTVIKFLVGEQGPRKGLLAGGILNALSPTHLIEGAIEMPLLAWARQAEITADRAGLLAVGDEEIARRVLLSWSLKSSFLYRKINVAAWLEQQAAGDDEMTKLSELTTSSTPYIARRLKLLAQFAASPELQRWRAVIGQYVAKPQPAASAPPAKNPPAVTAVKAPPKKDTDIRMKCSACGTPMRVPLSALEGKQQLNVRCPNAGCGKIATLKKKVNPADSAKTKPADAPNKIERSLDYDNE